MTVTIAPFTRDTNYNNKQHEPITYWGIYLDGKYISYTSNRESAEKTKLWIEKWIKDRY